MDVEIQLQLVRAAITSRTRGCCEWDDKAAARSRSDRGLDGLTPEAIRELLQEYVRKHPETVTARKETRPEYCGVRDFWFRVILPVDGMKHGLFVELVLEDDPDPEIPGVVIVSVHEQRR
jgi:hypothetical protein